MAKELNSIWTQIDAIGNKLFKIEHSKDRSAKVHQRFRSVETQYNRLAEALNALEREIDQERMR